MRAYIVQQSIEHLKNVIQQGGRQLSTTNQFSFMKVFLESIVLLLDKINAKKKDFEQFFVTKQGFFASKSTKNTALSTMSIQHIFNKS